MNDIDTAAPQGAPAYRSNGQPCSREAFYALACDPERHVVVEACAGAGKTWMLVSRVLRALLSGASGSEILAITFTRKAAGEMAQRLHDWLAHFASAQVDDATRAKELVLRGMAPRQAAELAPRLAGLQARLLANADAVEIRTFHSWFIQLVSQAPAAVMQRLGLSVQPQWLEDDITELHAPLLQRFHEQLAQQPALRQDHARLVARHGRDGVRKWLLAALERRAELLRADDAGVLQACLPLVVDALADLPAHAAAFEQLARHLGALSAKACQKAAAGITQALAETQPERQFESLRSSLFTTTESPRQLGQVPGLPEACAVLDAMAQARTEQLAREDHQAMVGLWRVLADTYAQLKLQRGQADMIDAELAAHALLTDQQASAWVQQRLDARIRHLLIDEFQDTSVLQWQALQAWLSSYSGAGGGRMVSVFLVGDPKQSIYRWRGAEPKVFAAARELVVQGLGGDDLSCNHTRRNAPQVVQAVNAVFGATGAAMAGFQAHTTESSQTGAVQALLPDEPVQTPARKADGRADEGAAMPELHWRPSLSEPRHDAEHRRRAAQMQAVARQVAHWLAQGLCQPGEVMALARTRQALADLASALAEAGVPAVVAAQLPLAEEPAVQDLLAVLDVLASPGHHLSLARALKSPLFSACDEDLSCLARAAAAQDCSWWHALMQLAAPTAELARARSLLQGWQAEQAQRPPHDLLDLIVHQSQAMQRYAARWPAPQRQQCLHAIESLLHAALQLDGARYASTYGFVRALRSRSVGLRSAAHEDAVQLLTVHGAKGLEAELVVVADTQPGRANERPPQVWVDWAVHEPAPRAAVFLPAAKGRVPPSLRQALQGLADEAAREELNGLYVAMTRARRWLLFSATPSSRASQAISWWQRVQPVAPLLAQPPERSLPMQSLAARVRTLPVWLGSMAISSPQGAMEAERPEATASQELQANGSATDTTASLLGQALHRALEWLSQPGAQRQAPARAHAARMAALAMGLPAARLADLLAAVDAVLDGPQCQAFFNEDGLLWAGNEVPLVFDGEALRIDRLVRLRQGDAEVWWVLDFKLASSPQRVQAYREQVQRYRHAVQRAAGPGAQVRCGLINAKGQLFEVGGAD